MKGIQMKKLLLLLLFPCVVQAAPFLVSDPDPAGVSDKCVWQEGTNAPVETSTVAIAPSTIVGSCHIDVAPFTAGTHQLQVWFKSTLYGVASAKVPFTLQKPTAGGIAPPNLRIEP